MITPAISGLSALKGLEIVTPGFSPYIIPITAVLLTGLFAVQFKGASAVVVIFGPPMLVWFAAIAALGAVAIAKDPEILAAFNPAHGARTFCRRGK
jgi:KUP system potassium uptake protein